MRPYYLSKFKNNCIVNLLYLEEGKKSHYVLIKSLAGLLKSKTKYNKKHLVCNNCLQRFWSLKKYGRHRQACFSETGQVTVMPEDDVLKFKNYQYRFPNVATIYAGRDIQAVSRLHSKYIQYSKSDGE